MIWKMVDLFGKSLIQKSSTSAAGRTARAIEGVNEVNCREIWKMVCLSGKSMIQESSTSAAGRTARAIAGVNEVNCREIWKMVGVTRIELVTSSMSTRRSPAELYARSGTGSLTGGFRSGCGF